MHSMNHSALAHATAAEHRERALRVRQRAVGRAHPPPLRGVAAALTARLAVRIDREAARRAIA